MSRLLAILFMIACGQADARTVRMLFVGIDHYQYSDMPSAQIADLQGPVDDVALMKTTLHRALGLDVAGQAEAVNALCPGPARTAITLIDAEATRAALLAALTGQICRARSGDIVLFYFAGHGSTYADSSGAKAGGKSDTILPYDARKPGNALTEIIDAELKAIIAKAGAKGVSVVTIFDSCHSGTATRALAQGHSRAVPQGPSLPLDPKVRAALDQSLAQMTPEDLIIADGRAYRVHLAAADDSETAHEYLYGKAWHGAFTLALAAQIARRPGATYGDLARATRLTLDDRVSGRQHPQAEGALLATFLGSDPGAVPIYSGERVAAAQIRIDGGLLSGVSLGSIFAIYRDATSASAQAAPLGKGTVSAIEPDSALLTTDGGAHALPHSVSLREIQHRYGEGSLEVALRIDQPRAQQLAEKTLDQSNGLMQRAAGPADLIVAGSYGQAALCDSNGRYLESLGGLTDPLFPDRLATAARSISRFHAMLALRNDEGPERVSLAIDRNCDGRADAACPDLPTDGGEPLFKTGERFRITAENRTRSSQYIYLFDLEPDRFSVTPLQPAGAHDALAPGKSVSFTGTAGLPGRAHLLLISTTRAIDMSMLAQDGLSRDLNPLAKLLQAAENGVRAVDTPQVGDWGGTLVTLRVVDSSPPAPEPPSPCASFASSAALHSH